MIYLIMFIILSSIIGISLWALYYWYKEEQKEQDDRTNVLEERLEDYKKDKKDEMEKIFDILKFNLDKMKELETRIQKLERKKKSDKQ